jgi:hypothetical protein
MNECLGTSKCDFFIPTGAPIKCVWLSMFEMGNVPMNPPICQNPYHGIALETVNEWEKKWKEEDGN